MNKKFKVKDNYKKELLLYTIFFVIMLILSRAKILEIKMLFAPAFAFSLVYLRKNVFVIALSLVVCFLINELSFISLIVSLSFVSPLILLFLIYKIINKNPSFVATILFFIIGCAGYLYFNIFNATTIIITIVCVVVSIMFLYLTKQVFNALFTRGLQTRLTLDENICLAIFCLSLFSGIVNIYIFKINVSTSIIVFLVLLLCKILNRTKAMYILQLLGIGVSLAIGNVVNIAIYTTFGLVVLLLKDMHKLFSIVAVLLLDMLFGYFFNVYAVYSIYNILSIVIGGLFYLVLPNRVYNYFRDFLSDSSVSLANEFIVYDQKVILKNNLLKVAELFKFMQNTYIKLSLNEMNKESVLKILTEDIINKKCLHCFNYNKCVNKISLNEMLTELFNFGLEKGKVTVIDANNLLTQNCGCLNSLISEVNNNLESFNEYKKTVEDNDVNKLISAEQFFGTSIILKELADKVITADCINYSLGKVLLDELTLNNIVAKEVVVLEGKNGVERIILIVRNLDVSSKNIDVSLKSVFKTSFQKELNRYCKVAGWSVLCYSPAPKYDLSVGFASSNKSNDKFSGDNFTCVNLNYNKVLVALSDGMGHGEKANEISTTALNLIESFYQAGFSSEVILSSVNKLLLPGNKESFTTFDACVFNKNNATVDFIKAGATCSVIKSENTVKMVELDALPLGIIENMQIRLKKCVLKNNDIVVLASDGVVDSFYNVEDYINFVNNERVVSAQMLASAILDEAQNRDKEGKDDKTVITFKVNYKV